MILYDNIQARIEIPRGCRIKYEIKQGSLTVDRILKVAYPFNYGYLPNTLWEDGDALDVILVGNFSIVPMAYVDCKPLALVEMYDQGVSDFKLVTAINGEQMKDYWETIKGFLRTYKEGVEVKGYTTDKEKIDEAIDKAFYDYSEQRDKIL